MHRRTFLATSLAASVSAASQRSVSQTAPPQPREYYQIRQYRLQSGAMPALTEAYVEQALIPAVNRLGMGPVGAFRLEYGPETPVLFVLIAGRSVESLVTLDTQLAADPVFLKAADPFWNAPAKSPAFIRVESRLLRALEGWPALVVPPGSATAGKRIVQLRTYESPSYAAHVRKVEMFAQGEFGIFRESDCNPVFFADTLIGPRMPSLTYMLSFADMAALEAGWAAFGNNPAWKRLASSPRYNYESIVSNVSNLILSPISASQI